MVLKLVELEGFENFAPGTRQRAASSGAAQQRCAEPASSFLLSRQNMERDAPNRRFPSERLSEHMSRELHRRGFRDWMAEAAPEAGFGGAQ